MPMFEKLKSKYIDRKEGNTCYVMSSSKGHVFYLTADVSVILVPDIVSAPHCTHKHTNTEKTNTFLPAT